MSKIRLPAVAGQFYPLQPPVLGREIKKYLDNADPPEDIGEIKCLIAPHAGYIYSGPVAAFAYKTLMGKKFDTVVVLAPSHRERLVGAAVFDGDFYRTPLGDVPVNKNMAAALLKASNHFLVNDRADRQEHSLEVQVPFLQTVLKDFQIVPVVIGGFDLDSTRDMAAALAKVAGEKNILLVASTDLSHFYPTEVAEAKDTRSLELIAAGNYRELLTGGSELCGIGPVVMTLIYAEKIGAEKIRVLKYAHSGAVTGDNSEVVGYGAAVIYGD